MPFLISDPLPENDSAGRVLAGRTAQSFQPAAGADAERQGLNLRIATARKELERIHEFDYCVVNHDMTLDDTVDKIIAIIEAEHSRVRPRRVSL